MVDDRAQVIILTEAGHSRGYGHVVRCAALQDAFRSSGCGTAMWVDSKEPLDERIVAFSPYMLADWKANLAEVLPASGPKPMVTVVDSYEADRTLLEAIASRSRACCFFDDAARIEYPNGTLVNAAIFADSLYPSRRVGIRYLTGPQYAVLRKDFWENRSYLVRDRIERVMVALGSGVARDEAHAVALTLKECLSDAKITVLHKSARSWPKGIKTQDIQWTWGLGAREFIELATNNDLAVCSGGQVILELARLGVPTISIVTADNQQSNVFGFEQTGFSVNAGRFGDQACLDRLKSVLGMYAPTDERARRSALGRKLVDGQGAFRIVQALKEAG